MLARASGSVICPFNSILGLVAQLGAHHIRIVGVEGSNPFESTRNTEVCPVGGPLYFCIRYVGFEPEGSWKRAGGTFQPEAACPAGQVESLRVHHVGASCISLAPTFYAFGKKVRVRSFRCSSLAKLQPLALGCSLGMRG